MPVCIAGMPHSGMGLVARLLAEIGLDLGYVGDEAPSPDERCRFAPLNDEILGAVGAAWNAPPRETDWVHKAKLDASRQSAAKIADALHLTEPWGWADPRNSLTVDFWRELFPDLSLLVCVRDPREVANSLDAGGVMPSDEALGLWREYYSPLLELGDTTVVTHYDSYREDPGSELRRVIDGLGLEASPVDIDRTAALSGAPPTTGAPVGELSPDLQELHDRLRTAATAPPRREVENLRLELARAQGQIEALRVQVEVRGLEPVELREIVRNLGEQLAERDQELEQLRTALAEGDVWRRRIEIDRRLAVEALQAELQLIKSTRIWNAARRYWELKRRVRRLARRSPT